MIAMESATAARNDHAAVRIPLPRTSRWWAAASNPLDSRACCGTCRAKVDSQTTASRASPIQGSAPGSPGRLPGQRAAGGRRRRAPRARHLSRHAIVSALAPVPHVPRPVPLHPLQADRQPHDVSGESLHRRSVLRLHPHPIVDRYTRRWAAARSRGRAGRRLGARHDRGSPVAAWREPASMAALEPTVSAAHSTSSPSGSSARPASMKTMMDLPRLEFRALGSVPGVTTGCDEHVRPIRSSRASGGHSRPRSKEACPAPREACRVHLSLHLST